MTAWDRRRAGFRRFVASDAARVQLAAAKRVYPEFRDVVRPSDFLWRLEAADGDEAALLLTCVIGGAGSGSVWRDLAIALVWLHLEPALHRRFVRRAMQFRGALDDAEDSYCTALTFVAAQWPRERKVTTEALVAAIDACVAVEACEFERWRKRHLSADGASSTASAIAGDADLPASDAVGIAWEQIVRQGADHIEHAIDARRALDALESVAPDAVDAVVARIVEDESLRVIATRGAVTHATVRRRVAAALIRVRQVLRGGRDDA